MWLLLFVKHAMPEYFLNMAFSLHHSVCNTRQAFSVYVFNLVTRHISRLCACFSNILHSDIIAPGHSYSPVCFLFLKMYSRQQKGLFDKINSNASQVVSISNERWQPEMVTAHLCSFHFYLNVTDLLTRYDLNIILICLQESLCNSVKTWK